jgi:hypothetical protein
MSRTEVSIMRRLAIRLIIGFGSLALLSATDQAAPA